MKRHSILPLILISINIMAGAQNTLRYNLAKYADLPTSDPELAARLSLRSQSALVDWLVADSTAAGQNIIMTTASSHVNSGDYLHYQGRHTTLAEARAGGEMTIAQLGTLYGHIVYSRQQQRNTTLNYADSPHDYMPYLVADTVEQGNLLQERYLVEGGFSFRLGTMRYGVSGSYEGTATAQETQPRRSVYNYWFRIGLSAAHVMPRWLASLQVTPEINKQSISASSAISTYTFAQFYGMGQFNRKESSANFGYSRQQNILGLGGQLLTALLPSHSDGWKATLTIGYRYRHMETEESNYKNLFATNTSRLTHQLTLSHPINRRTDLFLTLGGHQQWRKGQERVYQQQVMNSEQHLYDFVKVGTNHLYEQDDYSESLHAKAVCHASPTASLSLAAGLTLLGYTERYLSPWSSIKSTTLTPQVTVGYERNYPRHQFNIDLGALLHTNTSHQYTLTDQSALETAMAYIPYLLRGENSWQLTASAAYAYVLSHGRRIGCQVSGGYLHRSSAPYVVRTLFDSTHRHRLLDGSISLFFLF